VIEVSAHISAQPQEPSQAHSPPEGLLLGSGKAKAPKGRRENFAGLVKTLLENIKKGSPGLAEAQIQPENAGAVSQKAQDRKAARSTSILQQKDRPAVSKAKNIYSKTPKDEKEAGAVLPQGERAGENTGPAAFLQHETEIKSLPLPGEERDFSPQETHSLAEQRGNSGTRAAQDRAAQDRAAGTPDGRNRGVQDGAARFQESGRAEASGPQSRADLVDPGKDGTTGETRSRRRERTRGSGAEGRFEIRDFRNDTELARGGERTGNPGFFEKRGAPETELTVHLDGPSSAGGEGDAPSAPLPSFRDALAQELRGALGQDIVRHASMILKDGGEGLIRLSLKPESLGNVKIRLELSENKIAGHIIVENNEALRAFERELPVLEAAFKDSGFDSAALELAQNGAGGEGGQRNREDAGPFYSERLAASSYDTLSDYRATASEALIRADARVNMLA
jgi:hypothetical protein